MAAFEEEDKTVGSAPSGQHMIAPADVERVVRRTAFKPSAGLPAEKHVGGPRGIRPGGYGLHDRADGVGGIDDDRMLDRRLRQKVSVQPRPFDFVQAAREHQ